MTDVVVAPTVVVAPKAGTPEYDVAMAAKYEATLPKPAVVEAPAAPVRPEGVPEKFWDATKGVVNYAAWSASTLEAERKITELAGKKPEPVAAPAVDAAALAAHATALKAHGDLKAALEQKVTDLKAAGAKAEEITAAEAELAKHPAPPAAPVAAPAAADKALADKGLNMAEFQTEFGTNGALSEASYTKLAAAGIDKGTVDRYIAGQTALVEQQRATAFALTGGEENYTKMVAWAKTSASPADVTAFNASIAASTEQAHLAIQGMFQKYTAANGSDPALLGGNRGSTSAGFASTAEMTTAMKDSRYKTDPAYRAGVENRIAATTAF